ncbi:MAG: hypothetical protein ACRD47_02650 [Nitrososphaeraceae archaeon]
MPKLKRQRHPEVSNGIKKILRVSIHSHICTPFETNQSVYKQGKGSAQFPSDKPIPYGLVNKIVIFRVRDLVLSYT